MGRCLRYLHRNPWTLGPWEDATLSGRRVFFFKCDDVKVLEIGDLPGGPECPTDVSYHEDQESGESERRHSGRIRAHMPRNVCSPQSWSMEAICLLTELPEGMHSPHFWALALQSKKSGNMGFVLFCFVFAMKFMVLWPGGNRNQTLHIKHI